jgi:hypothetical protein
MAVLASPAVAADPAPTLTAITASIAPAAIALIHLGMVDISRLSRFQHIETHSQEKAALARP